MGKNTKQTTSFTIKRSFDIPAGLVAQRRAELIAAREQSISKAMALLNSEPLTHLTKSRPQIKHKKPSRAQRKPNSSSQDFFKEKEPITHEVIHIEFAVDWLNVLKNTISNAWVAYNNFYKLGINTRQPTGWFSWWRHSEDGQKRAERINNEAQTTDDTHKILKQLELFFEDPSTRFENHSFATYLFEQFNSLLERYNTKPPAGLNYDKNYWHIIDKQLNLLMAQEGYNHNAVTPVL